MQRARQSVLDRLRPQEARAVLTRLLSLYPDLISAAERAATEVLGEIDHTTIANRVVHALRPLHDGDEAERWARIEAALRPFLEDTRRRLALGLNEAALEICQGVILGLYRLKDDDEGPMVGAPTMAREVAEWAVERWSGHGVRALPRDFLAEHTPEWREALS